MSFLLEPNRLNVAISRAQCLSIVVGSSNLASGIANTVAEAEQINRLCSIPIRARNEWKDSALHQTTIKDKPSSV